MALLKWNAANTTEGWKRQVIASGELLRKEQNRSSTLEAEKMGLESALTRTQTQLERVENVPTGPYWLRAIEMMSENWGCFVLLLVAVLFLILAPMGLSWIWHWMWS